MPECFDGRRVRVTMMGSYYSKYENQVKSDLFSPSVAFVKDSTVYTDYMARCKPRHQEHMFAVDSLVLVRMLSGMQETLIPTDTLNYEDELISFRFSDQYLPPEVDSVRLLFEAHLVDSVGSVIESGDFDVKLLRWEKRTTHYLPGLLEG